MAGFGTDENALIRILATKNPQQMKLLREHWMQTRGKPLVQSLEHETSFNFKTALHYLVDNTSESKADYLWNAMDGVGTKDQALIDVLTQSTNLEIAEIKAIYAAKYHGKKKSKKHGAAASSSSIALEHDIRDETSGNFEKVLIECLKGTRNESPVVNDVEAARDAEQLYAGGEKRWGTDDTLFIMTLTQRSPAHIEAINRHYTIHHKHSVIEAIKKETSGDYENALVALATPKVQYIAHRLYNSMKGLGTNDLVLIYHLCTTYPLGPVKAAYQSIHGHSLESDISGDTSGDYKRLLLEIVRTRV